MEIGIIGKGKMGRDIFNYLLHYDHELVLICRQMEDVAILNASIEKLIRRMTKRGHSVQGNYKVSSDFQALKNCDVVIESIIEELHIKQQLFQQLESIVTPTCILGTNTSSLPLKDIFDLCERKDRCLGIHFFYPVKMMSVVEMNKTMRTCDWVVEKVKCLIEGIGKTPIELEEQHQMIINKFLLTLMARITVFYEEEELTAGTLDHLLKEHMLTYGLFEMMDSTGLEIILKSVENFNDQRHEKLYASFSKTATRYLKEGYGGGPSNKGFYDYDRIQGKSDILQEYDQQQIVTTMKSLLINEMASLKQPSIHQGVEEVLGLSKNTKQLLEDTGIEVVTSCLKSHYEKTRDMLYLVEDLNQL